MRHPIGQGTLSYTPMGWESVYQVGGKPLPYRFIHFAPPKTVPGVEAMVLPLTQAMGASLGEATGLFDEALALRVLNPQRAEVKLLDLLHLMAEVARGGDGKDDPRLRAVAMAMESRLSETLTLPFLAELAGITPDHLNRLWRSHEGDTVMDHLRTLRLKRAAWQLRHSTKTVSHVAAESGYRDLQVFNKAFRHEFGVAPRAYRAGRSGDI